MFNWANLSWGCGNIPFNEDFQDKYYADLGFEESCYVSLLQSSVFQDRSLATPFTIAEVGFGTGLNFLATCDLWIKRSHSQRPLVYISFEKSPLRPADLKRAQSRWTKLSDFKEKFFESYKNILPGLNIRYFPEENITLILLVGELENLLDLTDFKADHWLFDGFDPKKNRSCWHLKIIERLTKKSSPGATFGTFTAQGEVRRALISCGWDIKRIKGFAFKRHCLLGTYQKAKQDILSVQKKIFVTGNGIAAMSTKYFLSQFNAHVISERFDPPKASDIPYISCYPAFHSHLCDYSLFNLASFSTVSAFYKQLSSFCGQNLQFGLDKVVQSPAQVKKYFKALEIELISQFYTPSKTTAQSGTQFYFHDALQGPSLPIIKFFKENTNISEIVDIHPEEIHRVRHRFDALVLADSIRAKQWDKDLPYPYLLRGQIERSINAAGESWSTPTFDRYSFDPRPKKCSDHSKDCFVGFRAQLGDHLPLLGQAGDKVFTNIYHGSRGYSTGVYGALLVALELLGIFKFSNKDPQIVSCSATSVPKR